MLMLECGSGRCCGSLPNRESSNLSFNLNFSYPTPQHINTLHETSKLQDVIIRTAFISRSRQRCLSSSNPE